MYRAETDIVPSVKNLRKTYRDAAAVKVFDLMVRRGERFGLLGPNGIGKTATVAIFDGLSCTALGLPIAARVRTTKVVTGLVAIWAALRFALALRIFSWR